MKTAACTITARRIRVILAAMCLAGFTAACSSIPQGANNPSSGMADYSYVPANGIPSALSAPGIQDF